MTSSLPCRAARWSAVSPSRLGVESSAPAERSACVSARWPALAATISGVHDSLLAFTADVSAAEGGVVSR